MTELKGKIHSIETCGTVDGPGIRFVVFMQGCPMRCMYCHNPDTWSFNTDYRLTADEILNKYEDVKEFCKGGITVTGGEPLAQVDFVTELFYKAKLKDIHTALDTSGIYFTKEKLVSFEKLLINTDLVLLDIKHINEKEHIKLTGQSNKNILEFAQYLSEKNIPTWIRHVIVPKITDKEIYLQELGKFLSKLNNIIALDILPYHNMAIKKYEQLNIKYELLETPSASKEDCIKARNIIIDSIKSNKSQTKE